MDDEMEIKLNKLNERMNYKKLILQVDSINVVNCPLLEMEMKKMIFAFN